MKKQIGLALLMAVLLTACQKDHTSPRVPPPSWQTDQSGKYPVTMSAVVQLSADLAKHVQASDQMGAFVGEECRGTGTLVALDTSQVFFLLIHGTAAEQSQIQFKYYSAWGSHLYETEPFLPFQADGHYGSVDTPGALEFQQAP